ncbi:MAG: tRNA pseudouridine(55) synthase TruB [Clostridia bacterium]|nr:tRNA pseudouridine(55) synthase TruB [Clostridia bacterium]MCI8980055.1 tRNA pseudouridine(55) synthase TruB [Clostridia bacterium]MCI9085717.1 tRNA pseudouridine(55) synthase TruB [Clostridia bacterium]
MNGIIIIDKPLGRTSHDMVYEMRKVTGIKKIGHTGTLDPMATGVLPVCIGSATKMADMLTLSDKSYIAELVLGRTTDTQDADGKVLTECEVNCSEEEIRCAVNSFVGEIEQVPPMYSAIKQNGKKLYELARQGIEVERKPRKVTINSIDILEISGERVKIDVSCSKGTYIRTLCEDIGKKLGAGAYMNTLRRTRTGQFTIEESHTLSEIKELKENGGIESIMIPADRMFTEYPSVTLNPKQVKSVTNGVAMTYREGQEGQTYRVYDNENKFLCISRITDGRLKLIKSFWS